MDTFTDTSTDQAVAAVNMCAQGPSSMSEAVFHPDLGTMQQRVVGGVLASGSGNGEKSRNQGFQNPLY